MSIKLELEHPEAIAALEVWTRREAEARVKEHNWARLEEAVANGQRYRTPQWLIITADDMQFVAFIRMAYPGRGIALEYELLARIV